MAFHIAGDAWTVARLAARGWRENGRDEVRRKEAAPARRQGAPVLLLHGFAGGPHMLRPLGRFVRTRLGRDTLEVALGFGFGDVRDTALRVHALLEDSGVERYDVVGYSLGGIVAAYLLKCLDQGRRIGVVATLGSPHRGAPVVSRLPGLVARMWRSGAQLREGSALLESLQRLPVPASARMLSIAGVEDALVPALASRLEGPRCRNRVVAGVGHFSLLTSRRVYRQVAGGLSLSRSADPARSHCAVPAAERSAFLQTERSRPVAEAAAALP